MQYKYELMPASIKRQLKEECENSNLNMNAKDLYDNIRQSNGNHEVIAAAFNVSNVIVFKIKELNK